jgi:hypothetical protein
LFAVGERAPYGLRPYRLLRCTRCAREVETPCGCDPWADSADGATPGDGCASAAQVFAAEGARALHGPACDPEIPARCPSCKSTRWLEPRRWRLGHGQHPRSIARRAARTR